MTHINIPLSFVRTVYKYNCIYYKIIKWSKGNNPDSWMFMPFPSFQGIACFFLSSCILYKYYLINNLLITHKLFPSLFLSRENSPYSYFCQLTGFFVRIRDFYVCKNIIFVSQGTISIKNTMTWLDFTTWQLKNCR